MDPVHVRIRDFQSIGDLEMEIRGFTCVTGKSNIGKSAIVRAISSALLNRPVVGMVRKGAKACRVSLRSSKWSLQWEKSERGTNKYQVNDKKLERVGQGQLEDIARLGFGSIRVGDQDMLPWLAPQWKPIFLLDVTGTAVTEFISEVSRLKVLQDAIVMALKGRRWCLDRAKLKREELASLQGRDAQLDGLDVLLEANKQLDAQAESIEKYEKRLSAGIAVDAGIDRARTTIDTLQPVRRVRMSSLDLDDQLARLRKMQRMHDGLETTATKIIKLRSVKNVAVPSAPDQEHARFMRLRKYRHIDELRESVDAMEGVSDVSVPNLEDVSTDVSNLRQMSGLWQSLERGAKAIVPLVEIKNVSVPDVNLGDDLDRVRRGSRVASRVATTDHEAKSLERELASVKEELEELESELAAIEICPTCGSPIESG